MAEKKKDPREGHRQRLKDKFFEFGLEKFTEAEVLELLLSFGTPRRDCKHTARAMLDHFGTMREVFEASPELLTKIKGAGPSNIVAIKFIHAVAGKYLEQRLKGRSYYTSSAQINEYLRYDMESLDKEVFKVIYLDHNNAVLSIEDLTRGSITGAHVHPREVLERVILLKSTCLIFVHNHPGGNVAPSAEDQRLTRRLVHLANLAEMMVLDHIIIGKNGDYFSFKDNGLIAIYEQEIKLSYKLQPRPSVGLLHEVPPVAYTPVRLKSRKKKVKAAAGEGAQVPLQLPPSCQTSFNESTSQPLAEPRPALNIAGGDSKEKV